MPDALRHVGGVRPPTCSSADPNSVVVPRLPTQTHLLTYSPTPEIYQLIVEFASTAWRTKIMDAIRLLQVAYFSKILLPGSLMTKVGQQNA
jgi:hypothetical protein